MTVGGDYGKVFHRIWTEQAFRKLDARTQRLFVLLCTTPARNYAGVVPLTVSRWAASAAGETPETIRQALTLLCEINWIHVDEDTEEVLVRSYMRWDELWKQPQMLPHLSSDVLNTHSLRLRSALVSELSRIVTQTAENGRTRERLRELLKQLVEGLKSEVAEGFPEGLVEGFSADPVEGSVIATVTAPVTSQEGNCRRRNSMDLTEMVTGHRATPPDPPPVDPQAALALSNGHSRTAAQLVRCVLPKEQLQIGAVRTELTNQTCALLVKGVAEADIVAGLREWLTKEVHPKVLPSLVSDVIKRRSGTSAPTTYERKTARNKEIFDRLGEEPT